MAFLSQRVRLITAGLVVAGGVAWCSNSRSKRPAVPNKPAPVASASATASTSVPTSASGGAPACTVLRPRNIALKLLAGRGLSPYGQEIAVAQIEEGMKRRGESFTDCTKDYLNTVLSWASRDFVAQAETQSERVTAEIDEPALKNGMVDINFRPAEVAGKAILFNPNWRYAFELVTKKDDGAEMIDRYPVLPINENKLSHPSEFPYSADGTYTLRVVYTLPKATGEYVISELPNFTTGNKSAKAKQPAAATAAAVTAKPKAVAPAGVSKPKPASGKPLCKDSYSPALQPAMRAAGKCQ